MKLSTAARWRPAVGRRTRLALAALIGTAIALATGVAKAADDPSLTWWTLETDHFYITYPEQVEPAARRIADLAETVHVRVAAGMQFAPDEKTEILLTDDTDSANGSASPVPYNTIRLFLTAPGDVSTLGDYDDWYLGLLTHEYTHILHTGNISGLASVANRVIGRTLAPNSAQPRWIIEGLAVVFESEYSTGGRIRSSLFDMYLRADVLEDNFARLDQISSGAERWPYGNLFYLYGSRFLRWVTDIYGPDTMPAVSADYGAATIPWGINRAIRRVTGRTYEDLYDAWQLHLKRHYAAQVAEVDKRGRREGVRITFGAHGAAYPRFVPKVARKDPAREEIMYFRDDYRVTPGFYRFALGDVTKSGERDEEFEIRTPNEGAPAFSEAGDILFGSTAFYKNIYGRTDIHSVRKGETSKSGSGGRTQLTHGLRATQPDVSPDGKLVAFAVNKMGTTTLTLADRDVDGALSNVRPVVAGEVYDQVYSPRFSPDGKQLAYSAWSRGGFRDIRIVDLKTGKSRDVTRDRSLDMQPEWSSDGKSLYFSSDRTGIFNIYRIDLTTGDTKLVTNVHNGAVAPTVSADGKQLVYLGYTHQGFDLYAMPIVEDRLLSAPPPPEDRAEPYAEPVRAAVEKRRYNPLRTLRPYTYGFDVGGGNYSTTAVTLSVAGGDLVGHHSIGASVRFDPGAPEPRFDLSYDYGGLPVNVGASFTRQVVPRLTGFNVSGVDVPFDETQNSFSTYVSGGLAHPFVSQSASISYTATAYQGGLKTPAKLDPFETVTEKPNEGLLSQFRFSYRLGAFESSTYAAGGTRSGFGFGIGASVSDESIGATTNLYQVDASASAYVPMPWPGDQTIAMRASGAVSGGDYARRGRFFVGGYDFVNNSPLDTLVLGAYDGSFVLRGYEPGSYAGSAYLLTSIEYRAPIARVNWGPSTMPIFLRRIDASLFADWGGAFNEFQFDKLRLFRKGELLYSPDMHTSIGLEVWAALTLAHRVDTNLRLGYAYGFDEGAVENGQVYVLATSAF